MGFDWLLRRGRVKLRLVVEWVINSMRMGTNEQTPRNELWVVQAMMLTPPHTLMMIPTPSNQ